jgi:two-component system, OmpR family, sensor histidine kinase BaeS
MNTLRMQLLWAHLIVIAVTMVVFMVTVYLVTPRIRDRLVRQEQTGQPGNQRPGNGRPTSPPKLLPQRVYDAAVMQSTVIATVVASVVALVVSLVSARVIVRPLHSVITASRRVAAGDFRQIDVPNGAHEIRELALQFNHMAAALKDAEQRRAALIGDVAHELRTPLASIQGYAEGLIDGVVLPHDKTYTIIRTEAARLSRLVDDLQSLSRAESGSLVMHMAPHDLNAIVDRVADLLQSQLKEKEITLTVIHQHESEPVICDNDRISQVIVNLLVNAIRAVNMHGNIQVTTVHQQQMVCCVVTDDGIGIDATHLPHLFERFYRVDPSRTRATGGAGVGLTIARAIVEAHSGSLLLQSDGLGRGARVTLALPRA